MNSEPSNPQTRKKVWQYLLILVVLGLAVNVLLPRLGNMEQAWRVTEKMTWWAVLLAMAAEVACYFGYGYSLSAIMTLHNRKLSLVKGALISLSSASIGLVAGGWVAASAASFRMMRKQGADHSTASMAGVLPSVFINGVIGFVAVVGIVVLFMMKKLAKAQLVQYLVFLIVLTFASLSVLAAFYMPKTAFKVTNWVLWHIARLKKQPYDPAKTLGSVNNFINAWKSLGHGRWRKPLLGVALYIAFDMLCMYFFFLAAGYPVNPGVLFAGYGLPLLIAKIAFLFPGGIGVIEASMAAIFTSLGVPVEISAVVIIGYRLISFWMPMTLGFPASALLSRLPKPGGI